MTDENMNVDGVNETPEVKLEDTATVEETTPETAPAVEEVKEEEKTEETTE